MFSPNNSTHDHAQSQLPDGATALLGKGFINEIRFSPDGDWLAVASAIGIWIYNTNTGEELDLSTWHTSIITSICFSPDGSTLASGHGDGTVQLWDVATRLHKTTFSEHTRCVNSVAYSPDGCTLASAGEDNIVRLWNAATGKPIETFTEYKGGVTSVCFSPDGHILASPDTLKTSAQVPLHYHL